MRQQSSCVPVVRGCVRRRCEDGRWPVLGRPLRRVRGPHTLGYAWPVAGWAGAHTEALQTHTRAHTWQAPSVALAHRGWTPQPSSWVNMESTRRRDGTHMHDSTA